MLADSQRVITMHTHMKQQKRKDLTMLNSYELAVTSELFKRIDILEN